MDHIAFIGKSKNQSAQELIELSGLWQGAWVNSEKLFLFHLNSKQSKEYMLCKTIHIQRWNPQSLKRTLNLQPTLHNMLSSSKDTRLYCVWLSKLHELRMDSVNFHKKRKGKRRIKKHSHVAGHRNYLNKCLYLTKVQYAIFFFKKKE